ncbi:MAG: lipoate--protein ligase family protein [candidate division KSB1 bacterium]|nr:lipoate--protein ligase family protein [candidate division KSB1 bacterium]
MAETGKNPRWRLIDGESAPGTHHMAVDMAMAQLSAPLNIPTLRLYTWNPPAISMGYHQSLSDIDIQKCERDGIDVVIRPTGGRAILHDQELTYAVVLPPDNPCYHKDIRAVYELISRCLTNGLEKLNVPVRFERAVRTPKNFNKGDKSSLCYASSVQYEIRVGSGKLVGSAQRRVNNSVLQHGSILIGPGHLKIIDYMTRGDAAWKKSVHRYMQRHTACLQEFDPGIDTEQVRRAVIEGFKNELDIAFEPGDLTDSEKQRAEQLQPRFSALSKQWDMTFE